MNRVFKKSLIALMVFSVAFGALSLKVYAEDEEPAREVEWHESGTCEWSIDENGKLTVRPIDGVSGTLGEGEPWYDYRGEIITVVVENGVKTGTSCAGLFSGCGNCTSMDLSGLDTSAATNMGGMFFFCTSLTGELDLSSFNTSNVTNMTDMFFNCPYLESINVSSFDTGKVTKMDGMFKTCPNLLYLDLSSFKTNNVESAELMFGKGRFLWLKVNKNFCPSADPAPVFPRDLYLFGADDTNNLYTAGTRIPGNSKDPEIYTVRYNLSYDSVQGNTYVYYKAPNPSTLKDAPPLRAAAVIAWDIESPATKVVLEPGSGVTFDSLQETYSETIEPFRSSAELSKTLYSAIGTKVTLSYDANGGSNAPADQSITDINEEKDFTIAETSPSRSGFEFLGWASDPGATEAEYSPGDGITLKDDKTLYAVWKKKADPTPDTPYTVPKTGVDGYHMSYATLVAFLAAAYMIKKNH